MNKQYGKLTAEQFRHFVDQLPLFLRMGKDIQQHIRNAPKERVAEVLTGGYSWSWLYEFPFEIHVALVVFAFGLTPWSQQVADAPDPQQKLIEEGIEGMPEDFSPDLEPQEGIALTMSLFKTMESIALHGRSLSALLLEVYDDDNLDSLVRAIKIDRTVVNCPTVVDRIARAELLDDKPFFKQLSAALKGPSKKEWAGLSGMKFSFNVLKKMDVNDLSDEDLELLMVHRLDAYKDVPSARKNLRMQYLKSRKFKTI